MSTNKPTKTKKFRLTKTLAKKIDHLLSFGLTYGLGLPIPGQMCVEAVVCNALGEPHSDSPSCVGYEVRTVKIHLNDSNWSSNEARAKGMRDIAIAQLGSDIIDQNLFLKKFRALRLKRLLPVMIEDHLKAEPEAKEKVDAILSERKDLASRWSDLSWLYYRYYSFHLNYDKSDKFLLMSAKCMLDVLKELKSPGCKLLEK